ncbi:(2Fe-2S) ferredoxin domain-containing protein [Clostridium sediminicola]|uniref:(2Fe-2S) ferredoxin domain-containing protein n=1 Tax=Clostridium sediminicola TaxID=3114879 RepID=UPI0031F1E79D
MKKLTIVDLENIKKENLDRVNQNRDRETTRIVVGMATCGIAAGAQPVYDAMKQKIDAMELENVVLVKTGCIGVCKLEPIVEVLRPGEEKVTYVNMTPHKARMVIRDHIMKGKIVDSCSIHVAGNTILNDYSIIE